ncbi:hypothetical protein EGW08_007394 [Elysia chlorotica]|uniref:RING-type domain-containing protein n=1 Tax=Elysia chlorotica TaxID=188477 RepID=A0A3S0ZR86_ELYCH|nr:hypothetical protein EGW08_007394 [Elysia chlorotica]
MAECNQSDHKKRTKRQEDPSDCHYDDNEKMGRKKGVVNRLRKQNRFQALVEEREVDLDEDDSEEVQLCQDAMEEGTSTDMVTVDGKGGKRKVRMKNMFFWRKKANRKSKAIASPGTDIGGEEKEGQYHMETASNTTAVADDSLGACPVSHARPKYLTALEKWAARQREQDEGKNVAREDLRLAPPKTLKRQDRPEQNERKPWWWRPNRILRKTPKSNAAASPAEKTAAEPQKRPRTQRVELSSEETQEETVDLLVTADASIDDEHTCAICYEIMVRPHKVRPCDHVFCELCLRQLQDSTASRLSPWQRQGARNRGQQRDVLVLCPVCRGTIKKCQAENDLNEIIQSKYPHAYLERLKTVEESTRMLSNSRLPSSNPSVIKRLLPKQAQNHRVRYPTLKKVIELFGHFLLVLLLFIGGCALSLYLSFMLITVGLLKFGFACFGKSGIVFDKDRADVRSPITFRMMQVLGFVLFLITIKLFFTLYWGHLLLLSLLVLFCVSTGFSIDGHAGATVFKVVLTSIALRFGR